MCVRACVRVRMRDSVLHMLYFILQTLSEMLEQYLESDKVQSVVEHVQSQLDPGECAMFVWNNTYSCSIAQNCV